MKTMIGIAALACCSVVTAQGDWVVKSTATKPHAQAFAHIENTLGVKDDARVDYGTTNEGIARAEAISVTLNGEAQAESVTACETRLTYLTSFLYQASTRSMWETSAAGHQPGWAGHAKCHGNGYSEMVLESKKTGTARGNLSFASSQYGAMPTHLDEYTVRVGVGESHAIATWDDAGNQWEVSWSVVNVDESPDRIETSATYGGWEGLDGTSFVATAQPVVVGEEMLVWSSINYVFPEAVLSFAELINAGTRIDSELWAWGTGYVEVYFD